MNVKILTDTSCGMTKEEVKKIGCEMITLPFLIDDKEYDEDSLSHKEFYQKIRQCKNVHTSQASLETVAKKLDEMLEICDHIIYLPITSGLSGSFESANILLSDEKYQGKVTVIDHRSISVLQKALIGDIKKLIEENVEPAKIKQLVESNASNHRIYIALETLDYLKKGGRINPLVATIGNLLNIKPIVFSNGGKFDVVKKVRSMNAAEDAMKELVKNDLNEKFKGMKIEDFSICCSFTECVDRAIQYNESVKKEFGVKDTVFEELPRVIGCHTGFGSIALAIYKNVKM